MGTKGQVVDKFGDTVLCCGEIPGDSWRFRHDSAKQAIYQEAWLSKVPVDSEVYGLFGDLLPATLLEERGELQCTTVGPCSSRKGAELPSLKGPQHCLAELKCINAGRKWYLRGTKGKCMGRRAGRLNQEYEAKLRDLDNRFHGAALGGEDGLPPQPGLLFPASETWAVSIKDASFSVTDPSTSTSLYYISLSSGL